MNKEEALSMFAYDSWANGQLFDSASSLGWDTLHRDMGTSHGSLFGAMVHIVGAEEIWLSRWKGIPKTGLRSVDSFDSVEGFDRWWVGVRDERDGFLSGLTDDDVERRIEIPTVAGERYVHSFADMFRHLVNHGSYHRGQMVSLLRAFGVSPPATDWIRFYRQS